MKLEISHLKKSFGTASILNNVSLKIESGNIVALLGSSGSGKSTLLRCINLLEKADSGNIIIDDINIDFDKEINHKLELDVRKKVGMVFQQFYLWPHLTVLENLVTAPIYVLKKSKTEVINEAKRLLDKFNMLDKINSYPAQLSGGQQQRIAIARTLMMNPAVILFDEPTSALDPVMTKEVLKTIKHLAQEGMTMIIATHEIGFAREIASYAVFLDHGNVIECGDAKSVLFKPQTENLKTFLHTAHD